MSKPMTVTLPFIMILLDYWPLNRFEQPKDLLLRQQLKEKLPLIILAGIISAISLFGRDYPSMPSLPFKERILNAPVAFMTYLYKTFWPFDLAVFYPFPDSISLGKALVLLWIILTITVVVLWQWKRRPYLTVGWLWFFISIMPVIGIVQIGRSTYSMADRYHYLPSIGIGIFLAWGIPSVFQSNFLRKYILFPCGIIFIILMSFLTWKQCGYWKDGITLFHHALEVTGDNPVANNLLGLAYYKQGQYEQAIRHFSEAILKNPRDAEGYYFSRGQAYSELGQYQHALDDYKKVISLKPDYLDDVYNNIGVIYYKLGQFQKAIDYFTEAIRRNSRYVSVYMNRGTLYVQLGQYKNALDDFSKVISLDHDHFDAYLSRGVIEQRLGWHGQAVKDFSEAIRLKPDDYRGTGRCPSRSAGRRGWRRCCRRSRGTPRWRSHDESCARPGSRGWPRYSP